MPVELTEEQAHEQAVARASALLRQQFTEAMHLFAAQAELLLAPWDQAIMDQIAFYAFNDHYGLGQPMRLDRLVPHVVCATCARL